MALGVSEGVDTGLDGVLIIDKPAGWTSHDVVAKVRRLLGIQKVGHTGTLDPRQPAYWFSVWGRRPGSRSIFSLRTKRIAQFFAWVLRRIRKTPQDPWSRGMPDRTLTTRPSVP